MNYKTVLIKDNEEFYIGNIENNKLISFSTFKFTGSDTINELNDLLNDMSLHDIIIVDVISKDNQLILTPIGKVVLDNPETKTPIIVHELGHQELIEVINKVLDEIVLST